MKTLVIVLSIVSFAVGVGLVGCGPKKAASSREAIETSKAMQTVQEQANYLIGQAKAFYNSKDFQEAITIAQHVLSVVDKDSQEAKTLIEKAKAELEALARKKADELKNKLGIR
ncbi:MAG: hypothetical protein KBA46_02945 [Candidatus Omnitrophica bacterium]|nr:hypothetical protein [Candidatus Omnitrophota bacterium]